MTPLNMQLVGRSHWINKPKSDCSDEILSSSLFIHLLLAAYGNADKQLSEPTHNEQKVKQNGF